MVWQWLTRTDRLPEPAARITPAVRPLPPAARAAPGRLTPGEAFTPTRPKPGRRQIIGRQAELARILQALSEDRAHVVLYSERGRGKTSLSNLAIEALRQSGVIVARHTCEAGSSYDDVMRGLVRDLPRSLLAVPANNPDDVGCEAALTPGPLRPRDVVSLMSRLTCRFLVCVVDEFDRILDSGTRTRLADTIKQLSDGAVPMLFMIVGVSENLEQILGQHPSIQRNLVAVQLPLLRDEEVTDIIEKGAQATGFSLFPGAVERVASVARGSPYMAQLLGLRLIQAAARRGAMEIEVDDFAEATMQLLEEASAACVAQHAALTGNGDIEMSRAIRTIATADQDIWGRIRILPSLRDSMIVGRSIVIAEHWQRILDSRMLRAAGHGMYLFADRSFLHHILLLAAHSSSQEIVAQPRMPVGGSVDGMARSLRPAGVPMRSEDR